MLTGVLVLAVVVVGTVLVSGRIAREDSLVDAARSTSRFAELMVGPQLASVLAGTPGARAELDQVVAIRTRDGSMTEINVWTPDGVVVYSSDPGLIGRSFPVSAELVSAADGTPTASFADTRESGTSRTAPDPELEVYLPLTVAGEGPLVLEAYYPADGIDRTAERLRTQIVPMAVVSLVLLQLAQLPLAVRMARRVEEGASERARLLSATLSASERERQALAADLHDGPIQELAGLGYGLGALQMQVEGSTRPAVDRLSAVLEGAVAELRRLMVEVYPPDLDAPGLGLALTGLLAPLRERGLGVALVCEPPAEVAPDTAATVYRAAREALANVLEHAAATNVRIEVGSTILDGSPAVQLRVVDDGIGLTSRQVDRRAEGHLGLRLVVDQVTQLGGRTTLSTGEHGGTVVELVLPTVSSEVLRPPLVGVRPSPVLG